MEKISLKQSLSYCQSLLEKEIGEVVGIQRITPKFSSSSNNFVVKMVNQNKPSSFFLKFCRSVKTAKNEIKHNQIIRQYLPIPEILFFSEQPINGYCWILYDFVKGKLLSEYFHNCELTQKFKKVLEIEEQKEKLLQDTYLQNKSKITFKQYLSLTANNLFYKRLKGQRMKEFYSLKQPLNKLINLKIFLNNKEFPFSFRDILQDISNKYLKYSPQSQSLAFLGLGDAHHGNIFLAPRQKIWFLDNEYAGYLPFWMETAKPYYNDFLGTLFYPYSELIQKYFVVKKASQENNSLKLEIYLKRKMDLRIAITQIKINSRKKIFSSIKGLRIDFLTLNDYLVMCHTLTRNPNILSAEAQYLFLALTFVLKDFDPLKPESIYHYFPLKS